MTTIEKINQRIIDERIPFSCVFELTYRCNLICDYCYINHNCPELPYNEITKILDDIANAGTMFLTFTGGEVFLRRDP